MNTVTFNADKSQWELKTPEGKVLSFLAVEEQRGADGHTWQIGYHTETDPFERRKGYANALIVGLLTELAKDTNKRFLPLCPFAAWFYIRHPEWDHTLPADAAQSLQAARAKEHTLHAGNPGHGHTVH